MSMDFASLLCQLEHLHERECKQRKEFEAELHRTRKDCSHLRQEFQQLQEQALSQQGAPLEFSEMQVACRDQDDTPRTAAPNADTTSPGKMDRLLEGVCTPTRTAAPNGARDSCTSTETQGMDACVQTSPQDFSPHGSVSFSIRGTARSKASTMEKARLGGKKLSQGSNDNGSSWPETDVNEFALMKGWGVIQEQIQKRKKSENHPGEDEAVKCISATNLKKSQTSFQRRISDIVQHKWFDLISAIAIMANTILIGIAADYVAQNRILMADIPSSFKAAERTFTVVFTVELVLRLLEGRALFFYGPHTSWNVFDLIVVSGDVLQTVLELAFSNKGVDLKILRVLRVTRITRAIRVIRLVSYFKELRMMVYSILRCGTSLMWSLMLFFIVIFMFGMFLITQVTDYLVEEGRNHPRADQMWEFFGSVPQTIYTLYCCMAGGISWMEVSDDLIDIHWTNAVVLCFFVFFTLFVVSNILTGIFVDTAIQSATSDREEIVQEQLANQESELMKLKAAFEEADSDDSGTISKEEFFEHMQDQKVRVYFKHIGIEVHQAMGMFKLLDIDRSGQVNIEEFVMGCMRLKGGAKSIDLATLMYENKRLVERIATLESFCRQQFQNLWNLQEASDNKIVVKSIKQLDSYCRDQFFQLNIFQETLAKEMHLPGSWNANSAPAPFSIWSSTPAANDLAVPHLSKTVKPGASLSVDVQRPLDDVSPQSLQRKKFHLK